MSRIASPLPTCIPVPNVRRPSGAQAQVAPDTAQQQALAAKADAEQALKDMEELEDMGADVLRANYLWSMGKD